MSKPTIKYKLYGEIIKIDKVHGRDDGMYVLTITSTGEYTTQVGVMPAFMRIHKPQVGQFMLKQLDDTTIVVTKEEFFAAVLVKQEVAPMEESELNSLLAKNANRYLERRNKRIHKEKEEQHG